MPQPSTLCSLCASGAATGSLVADMERPSLAFRSWAECQTAHTSQFAPLALAHAHWVAAKCHLKKNTGASTARPRSGLTATLE
jgi:hypothetical protein